MLNNLPQLLNQLGSRIQNYGYLLANSSYSQVRDGKGCAELYRLLNKNWFPQEKIQFVLDVGANEGQFIRTSLALMPKVPVYAFEPNIESVQKLKVHDWSIEEVTIVPIALGSHKDTLSLNVSQFSPASSLLKNTQQLIAEYPETVVEKTIDVEVERLDSVVQQLDIKASDGLLKIDVQGFEMEVLKGAVGVFDQILVIVCEVNLTLFYEQQCTLDSILAFLQSYHYQLVDIGEPVRSHTNQEVLYVDLAFIRKS